MLLKHPILSTDFFEGAFTAIIPVLVVMIICDDAHVELCILLTYTSIPVNVGMHLHNERIQSLPKY